METITQFEAKRKSALETLTKLKEANATEAEIEKASIMFHFWEAMEQEAGEELGALLYEFAVLVDFDTKLLRPIALKDTGFWTDIESMGFLEFQLKRLELERTNRIITLLQSIDISLKSLVPRIDLANVKAEMLHAGSLINRTPDELKEAGVESDEMGNLKVIEEDIDVDALING